MTTSLTMTEIKQAVVALIPDANGLFLAVPRRNRPDFIGLPGGKVDPGETLEEAIRRETLEETNIELGEIELIFQDVEKGEVDFKSYCFYAKTYKILGELKGDTGQPVWVKKEDLTSPKTGAFPNYNAKVFSTLQGE